MKIIIKSKPIVNLLMGYKINYIAGSTDWAIQKAYKYHCQKHFMTITFSQQAKVRTNGQIV